MSNPRYKLTAEQRSLMVERYQAGGSLTEIATEFGCSYQNLRMLCLRRGIAIRPNSGHKFSPEQHALMVAAYQAGESSGQIADRFGGAQQVVLKILERRGVVIRKPPPDFLLNESFFEAITTEEQAWLLGWIATDGNICRDKRRFSLTLQQSDCTVLDLMATILGTNRPVVMKSSKSGRCPGGVQHTATLTINSKRLVADLIALGVTPNKTFTIRPWQGPAHLLPAYWRGCFEGDGGLWLGNHSSGHQAWVIQFAGTLPMVEGFVDFARNHAATSATIRPVGSIYEFRCGGHAAQAVAKALYDGATVWLDRKRLMADRLLAHVFLRNRRPQFVT